MPSAARGSPGLTPDNERPVATRRAVRPSAAGLAASLVLAAALAACGSVPTPQASASPRASGSSVPAASRAPATATAATAAARLDAGLAALAAGYRFTTTVRVGQVVATTIEGRVRDGASELVVTAAGTMVTYRAVPPNAWARKEGGGWEVLDTAAPAGNPLDALRATTAIEVLGDGPDGLRIAASYPASQLGLAGGNDAVRVTLVLAPDGTIAATYTTATSGVTAASETTFRADPDQEPITAPATTTP